MPDFSRHQQKIIKNYYENRDSIALQKAQELVTELYLAEGKKLEQCWKRMRGHLEKLTIPAKKVDKLIEDRDPAAIAEELKKFV
ncbi:MAG: hypothetical protein AAFP90_13935 [Planctomycetota bacterium]